MNSWSAEHSIHHQEKIKTHVDFKRNHRIQSSSFEHQEETIIRKKHLKEKSTEGPSSCDNEKIKFDRNKLQHLFVKRNEIIQDMEQVRKSIWVRGKSNRSRNSCNRLLLIDHEEQMYPYSYNNRISQANTQTLNALAELAKKQRWRQQKESSSPNGVSEFYIQINRDLNDDIISHMDENTFQCLPPQDTFAKRNTSLGMISADSSIHEQDETLSVDEINTMMTADDTQEDILNNFMSWNGSSVSYNSPCTITSVDHMKANIQHSDLESSSDTNNDSHVDYLEQLCTLCNPLSTRNINNESLFEQDEMDDSFQNLTLLKTWDNDSSCEDDRSYVSALTYEDECKRSLYDGNTKVKKLVFLVMTLIFCITCDWNLWYMNCSKMCISARKKAFRSVRTLHGGILAIHVNIIDSCKEAHQMVRNILDLNQLTSVMHEYFIQNFHETEGYHGEINYRSLHKLSSSSLEQEMTPSKNLFSDASQIYFIREIYSCDPVLHPITSSIESSFQREKHTYTNELSSINDVSFQTTPRLLCLNQADFGFKKYQVLYQKDLVSIFVENLSYDNEIRIMKKWKLQVPNMKLKLRRRSLIHDSNLQWSDSTKVAIYQSERNAFLFRRRVPSFFTFNRMATTTSWMSNSSAIEHSTEIVARNNANRCLMGDRREDSFPPVSSHLDCHHFLPVQATRKPSVREYLNSNEDDISFDMNIGEQIMELIKLIKPKPRLRKFG